MFVLAIAIEEVPPNIKENYMKKLITVLSFSLFILSCQSNSCQNFCSSLSDKIAKSYECSNPEVFYNYLSKVCPNKTQDPGSIAGKLACKFGINFISDNINSFSEEGKCKKDFISEENKNSLIDICTTLVP